MAKTPTSSPSSSPTVIGVVVVLAMKGSDEINKLSSVAEGKTKHFFKTEKLLHNVAISMNEKQSSKELHLQTIYAQRCYIYH